MRGREVPALLSKLLLAMTIVLSAFGAPDQGEFSLGGHYLAADAEGYLTLWEESNGQPGLQTAPVTVGGVVLLPSDARLHL